MVKTIKTSEQQKSERTEARRRAIIRRSRKGVQAIKKQVKLEKETIMNVINKYEIDAYKEYQQRSVPGADPLTDEELLDYAAAYNLNPINTATQNSLSAVPISWLAEDRKYLQKIDYAYSHLPECCPRATYQASSGRCWLFAALNTMRHQMIKNLKLNDHFELSEAYLFFFDKIERALFYLEKMVEFRDAPVNDTVVHGMMSYCNPTTDGGTWSFFTNLISKYGIVPKSCYGENFNSNSTGEMNEILQTKLGQFTSLIRSATVSDKVLQKRIRSEYMPEIYSLMVKFLGEPPRTFDWKYHETADTFESIRERGPYKCERNLTPMRFYLNYIEPDADLANKIVLRHDPRDSSEYYKSYYVEHFGHMVGGTPDIAFNVPWEVLSRTAAQSVMNGQQLWFAADVCKNFNNDHGVLSTEAFNYDSVLDTELGLSKGSSLDNRVSYPSHAMVLVGVDVINNSADEVVKWKVENSWGESSGGADPGYLLMTQTWFEQYGYEVVVDINALDEDTTLAYKEHKFNPIALPYNDAFGAVARRGNDPMKKQHKLKN